MSPINFTLLTSLAYEDLLSQHYSAFPIDPAGYDRDGVVIATFQEYSAITGCELFDLTCDFVFEDGFACRELRPGLKLILYNDDKIEPRKNHSLCHEIGHLRAHHSKHGETEEIEAHFFASQMLVPNAIIAEIKRRGYKINVQLLTSKFGVSSEAAEKKIFYLARFPDIHKNELDDLVLMQFWAFINSHFPQRISNFLQDREHEYEGHRQEWLYDRR